MGKCRITKYEKETIILFNEAEPTANVYTYNTALKNRLARFSKENPSCAKLITTYPCGAVSYEVDNITDWLSIPILFVMLGFAIIGLVQLIKRKSLLRVDSSILILGGFYVLVFLAYLFFEFFVVNYRPVLIKGFLEASYPSSTTMLMMCIIPTAIMQFQRLISSKGLRNIVNTLCGIYAGFMVIGRVLSGVHWITDIVGGILFSATFVMLYYSINQWVNSKANRASQRSR